MSYSRGRLTKWSVSGHINYVAETRSKRDHTDPSKHINFAKMWHAVKPDKCVKTWEAWTMYNWN